jgi:hypothetical protein
MRNTLIAEIANQSGLDLQLQRLTTIQLVGMSMGIFP